MKVTLTKRLGQNRAGATLDTTVTQARWMFEHGVAVATDDTGQGEQAATTEQTTDTRAAKTASAGDSGGETPKAPRGRRTTKTTSTTKPDSE